MRAKLTVQINAWKKIAPFLVAGVFVAIAKSETLVSPFEPVSNDIAPPAQPAEKKLLRLEQMEFTGFMEGGGETIFTIYDSANRQTYWVPLGGVERGVQIKEFDEERGIVSVVVQGYERDIAINKRQITQLKTAERKPAARRTNQNGSASRSVSSATSKPKKPARQRDPEVVAKEEEARMLVSDLLEIGMQERAKNRAAREERIRELRAKQAASRRQQ